MGKCTVYYRNECVRNEYRKPARPDESSKGDGNEKLKLKLCYRHEKCVQCGARCDGGARTTEVRFSTRNEKAAILHRQSCSKRKGVVGPIRPGCTCQLLRNNKVSLPQRASGHDDGDKPVSTAERRTRAQSIRPGSRDPAEEYPKRSCLSERARGHDDDGDRPLPLAVELGLLLVTTGFRRATAERRSCSQKLDTAARRVVGEVIAAVSSTLETPCVDSIGGDVNGKIGGERKEREEGEVHTND